jgi:hypothetical protein
MSELTNAAKLRRTRRNLAKAAAATLVGVLGVAARSKPARADWGWGGGHHHGGGGSGNCFLRGTRIRTVSGYRKVETLSAGDALPTLFGRTRRIRAVRALRFEKDGTTGNWREENLPIRIRRSALDDNVPHADLYVTGAHAVYVKGVLVPVSSLINGLTIARVEPHRQDILEYFHVELDGHDVIDAEGAPCETLRESGMAACAPIVEFAGHRSELGSRLRSALSPWIDHRRKLDIVRDSLDERADRLLSPEAGRAA